MTNGRVPASPSPSPPSSSATAHYRAKRVQFVREPKQERYGKVAVFRDLYGNLWDLLQPAAA